MNGAKPTGSLQNWSFTATEKFAQSMRHFQQIFVSVVGEKNDYQSFPVIVWGAELKNFDVCVQTKFHNINSWLHNLGLIDLDSPLQNSENINLEWCGNDGQFGFHDNPNSPVLETADLDEKPIGNILQEIKSWMPAQDSVEREFEGFVTYIDENGEISIRDEKEESVFRTITTEITNIYSNNNFTNVLKEITKGHSVIVYNEVDARKVIHFPNSNVTLISFSFKAIIEESS